MYLEACDQAVGEMEEEMMRELTRTNRAELLEALMTCVRSLHAGFPERAPAATKYQAPFH